MQQITPRELHSWLEKEPGLQLIDVREPDEHAEFHIGGKLFPLPEIMEHVHEIDPDRPVVFYCKMGVRSQIAIQRLEQKYHFRQLYNLRGGMEAWKKEFGS
jgi:adenylyltransferase/sulfurtransferase